jgi:hypothetical protein
MAHSIENDEPSRRRSADATVLANVKSLPSGQGEYLEPRERSTVARRRDGGPSDRSARGGS